jgi:hypothetical protein
LAGFGSCLAEQFIGSVYMRHICAHACIHLCHMANQPSGDMLCMVRKTGYWGMRQADVIMFLTRELAAAIAVLTACVLAPPGYCQPIGQTHGVVPRAPVIACTNPANGWTWQISIDYDRATVDSYPAQVSEAEISWHDQKDGGNYTLDRRSGELTVIVASSTGGYFLHDHCGLPP